MIRNKGTVGVIAASAALAGAVLWGAGQVPAQQGKILAQRLVEETLPKHPEITGLEMSAETDQGCKGIASTEPKDVGEKCDEDEWQPLRTNKPFVEHESDEFDVTVPFHDANGNTVAVLGMDFKLAPGLTNDSVAKAAQRIAGEMEKRVFSKGNLFETEK